MSKWNQMEYLADDVECSNEKEKNQKNQKNPKQQPKNRINNKYKDQKVRIRETRKKTARIKPISRNTKLTNCEFIFEFHAQTR